MHLKYIGAFPNICYGHPVWKSQSDNGGKWATWRSMDLDNLLEIKKMLHTLSNTGDEGYVLRELEVESVVLDTNPTHESSRGWSTEMFEL